MHIFNIEKNKHIEEGIKSMTHVTDDDVIDECLSHYREVANGIKGLLRRIRIR